MFDPSDETFEILSRALFRAGLFVSHADENGHDQNADLKELQSMSVLMHVMREQHKDSVSMQDIISKVHNHIRDHGDRSESTSKDNYESLCKDLQNAPHEVSEAISLAAEKLDKYEARLYSDIIIAFSASVAQSHFEGDHASLWDRFLITINSAMESSISKYLYDSNDMFDHMKISHAEGEALDQLSLAVSKAWFEKFPEDAKEQV